MRGYGRLIVAAAVAAVLLAARPAPAALTGDTLSIACPDWSIELDSWGYSDVLLDERSGYEGREYLSGEWAAAVGYTVGSDPARTPIWLKPDFIYPNWTTNSDFSNVVSSITQGDDNGDGLPTASSTVANSHLRIKIDYEILDTTTGVQQGTTPASSGGTPASVASNRYVLKQTYTITNISGQTVTGLEAYQFLHGLNSQSAVYDNRDYGGAMSDYRYDTCLIGVSDWFDGGGHALDVEDVLTLHSSLEPTDWEVGYYGINDGTDNHGYGKPSVGVHLSVEDGDLDGSDAFAPSELWVSGAQQYSLGSLNDGESASFDVLLSLQTTSTVVPEPATLALLAAGGLALAGLRRRRRRRD